MVIIAICDFTMVPNLKLPGLVVGNVYQNAFELQQTGFVSFEEIIVECLSCDVQTTAGREFLTRGPPCLTLLSDKITVLGAVYNHYKSCDLSE